MDERARLDPFNANRVIGGDGEHDLVGLIGSNRAIRQQQRIVLTAEQAKPAEETRGQETVLVVEDRAAAMLPFRR